MGMESSNKKSTWCQDVKLVLHHAGLSDIDHLHSETDLDTLKTKLMDVSRRKWHLEAYGKSKLCTFVKIHDFEERKVLLKANLERNVRSLIAKLKSGILPLRLETGRYKGMNREDRVCQVCDNGEVEDEVHFLFRCKPLKHIRKPYVKSIRAEFPALKKTDYIPMFKIMVNQDHIKEFGSWLEQMVYTRRDIIYK